MGQRLFRILVLLHAMWWFGYYSAAHQRGAYAIPGDDRASSVAVDACCGGPATDLPCDEPGQDGQDPSRHCFVCYLNAKLDVPPVVDLTVRPLGPLTLVTQRSPVVVYGQFFGASFHGRAPPIDSLSTI